MNPQHLRAALDFFLGTEDLIVCYFVFRRMRRDRQMSAYSDSFDSPER